ncbi:hypothetical protein Pfo_017766 [Paulownia fortunei]|nr:hypothetical protein Pfo_017766 [Paulownia fortunei]
MMGPSCRRSTRKSSSRRRTLFKKQPRNSKNQENSSVSPANSPVKPSNDSSKADGSKDFENVEMSSSSACSTPKAERFRIPEVKTCPPAPKKRRMVTSCSLRPRTSIAFFAPPDIELFFNFALCGIPDKISLQFVTHSKTRLEGGNYSKSIGGYESLWVSTCLRLSQHQEGNPMKRLVRVVIIVLTLEMGESDEISHDVFSIL